MGHPKNTLERIGRYIQKTDSCWNWTGQILPGGYGKTTVNYKTVLAHRFVYESSKGKIPDGLCLDHLCRNRSCVNPDHLEPVSHKENTARGAGPASENAKKTSCKRGHALSGDNLYITPDNRRQCKACRGRKIPKAERFSVNGGGLSR